jgi:hypothetical protein
MPPPFRIFCCYAGSAALIPRLARGYHLSWAIAS